MKDPDDVTICKLYHYDVNTYNIYIHTVYSGDCDCPFIRIECVENGLIHNVSLVDVLCKDEIVGIDWLREWFKQKPNIPGEWIDNLDAIIWYCDNESPGDNYVKEYIESRGKKILPKYERYFK